MRGIIDTSSQGNGGLIRVFYNVFLETDRIKRIMVDNEWLDKKIPGDVGTVSMEWLKSCEGVLRIRFHVVYHHSKVSSNSAILRICKKFVKRGIKKYN